VSEEKNHTSSRLGRVARSLLRFAWRLLLGTILFLVAAGILLQIPFVSTFVAGTTLRLANPWPRTSTAIGSAGGSWFSSLALTNVVIATPNDSLLISIDTLRVSYDLTGLAGGSLRLRDVYLSHPIVRTRFLLDKASVFLHPFAPDTTRRDTSGGLAIRVDHLEITNGDLSLLSIPDSVLRHLRVHQIHLSADSVLISRGIVATIHALHSRIIPNQEPTDEIQVDGAASLTKRFIDVRSLQVVSSGSNIRAQARIPLPFNPLHLFSGGELTLAASPVAYKDLHFFLPEVGPAGEAVLDVDLSKKGDSSSARVRAEFPGGGTVSIQGRSLSLPGGAVALEVSGTSRRFSPSALTRSPKPSESIESVFSIVGKGTSLNDFEGTATAVLSPSYFAETGPLTGKVDVKIDRGLIQAALRAELHPLLVEGEADLRPFESIPDYHVRGSIVVQRAKREDDPMRRLDGLAATVALSGSGLSGHEIRAHMVLEGAWKSNPRFKSLFIEATADHDTVHATGRIATAKGSLQATARAILSETPQYKVQAFTFRGVSLEAFGNGLPASELNGSLRAEGIGTSLESLSGKLALRLDSSRVGNVTVGPLRADVVADRGRFSFSGMAESDAGAVSLHAAVSPSANSPTLTLEQVDFRGLDLGKLSGEEGISSSLNGRMELHASARSMRDVVQLLRDSREDRGRAVRAEGIVRLEDSRFNKEEIRAGTITVNLLDGQLETNIDVRTSKGGVKGSAHARAVNRRFKLSVPSLSLDHLDIDALSGNGLRTDLTGIITGAFDGGPLESATGDLSVDFENNTSSAAVPARGSLRAKIAGGRFSLTSLADFRDGRVALEGEGRLEPGGASGKIDLGVALKDSPQGTAVDTADRQGLRIHGSVEGRWGVPANTDLKGILFGGGSHMDLRADTILCRLAFHGRVLDLDTLKILSNVASVTGSGTLAVFDSSSTAESDLALSAIATSLRPLEEPLGLDPTFLHSASVSLHVSGPPKMTEVHCETSVDMAAFSQFSLTSLQSSADLLLGPSMALESLDGNLNVVGFHYGPLVVSKGSVSVHSVKNQHDLAGSIQFGRGVSVNLGGTLRTEPDSMTIRIDSLVARSPGGTWSLDRQASIIIGPRLVVKDFYLRSGSRDLVINGVLDPMGEQDFTVSSDSLSFENIGRLFGRPALEGLIFSNIHVRGPGANPHAEGDLSISFRNAGQDLGRFSTHVNWQSRSLEIEGGIRQESGGNLNFKARLPVPFPLGRLSAEGASRSPEITRDGQLDVSLKAEGFDLEFFKPFLSPQTVSALGGKLTADIGVTGRRDSLVANGEASLVNGQLGIIPLGALYTGIQLHCAAHGKDLRIEDARTTSGEGSLRVSGLASLRDPAKPVVDLKMTLENFVAMQTPNLKAIVSGDLLLTGEVSTPTIKGNLSINDSYFVLPDAGKLDNVEVVELTAEDYATLQRYFGYTRPVTVETTGPSLFDPTLDITVAMQKNTWFRKRHNPTLAIELQGSVQIDRRAEQPLRILGTLRCPPGRSYVGQFGRQFELTEGEILLKGPVEETELRINSEYRVPSKGGTGLAEVVIRMKVETNLGKFIFSLTSDPPMEESDILSYLATGKSRTGALANTGDQGGLAGSMALEQLVGVAGGLTEGSMPLDVFQIRQEGARGIIVVAGNYVSAKTYLGIRQPILFNQGTEDSYYDTRTQYEFEYEAEPWLFLNLQGGSSRTLMMLKARVAY
jgi:hypothetical protein